MSGTDPSEYGLDAALFEDLKIRADVVDRLWTREVLSALPTQAEGLLRSQAEVVVKEIAEYRRRLQAVTEEHHLREAKLKRSPS